MNNHNRTAIKPHSNGRQASILLVGEDSKARARLERSLACEFYVLEAYYRLSVVEVAVSPGRGSIR